MKRMISTKLEPRSDKCTFIGYPKETRGYYFYKPSENVVFVARGVVFMEREFVSKDISGRTVHLEEIQDGADPPEPIQEPLEDPVEGLELELVVEQGPLPATVPEGPRRSERPSRPPPRYGF